MVEQVSMGASIIGAAIRDSTPTMLSVWSGCSPPTAGWLRACIWCDNPTPLWGVTTNIGTSTEGIQLRGPTHTGQHRANHSDAIDPDHTVEATAPSSPKCTGCIEDSGGVRVRSSLAGSSRWTWLNRWETRGQLASCWSRASRMICDRDLCSWAA